MNILNPFLPMLLHGLVGSAIMFSMLWMLHLMLKNAGIVSVGWAAAVGAMALYAAIIGPGWLPRRILLGTMAGIWALRLVLHTFKNQTTGPIEDARYQRLRSYWGDQANALLLLFFTAQSLLVVLFTLPFIPCVTNPHTSFTLFDMLALLIWLISMVGEWMADRQLARFKRHPDNNGKVCQTGLWKHSRHPNYFFEWTHWFTYLILAVGSAGAWLALTGPIAMYLLLVKLSGIPHAERESLAKRGEAYREYQRTTPMMIPRLNRRRAQ